MGSLHASQKWSLSWKKIFFVLNHQNIGCKLLSKEEKELKSETWPFTHFQTRSNHCDVEVSTGGPQIVCTDFGAKTTLI